MRADAPVLAPALHPPPALPARSDRKPLPAPVAMWQWGWTRSAETWNGRIAMLAILAILAVEVSTGQGILSTLWALPDAGVEVAQ